VLSYCGSETRRHVEKNKKRLCSMRYLKIRQAELAFIVASGVL
jgi:hypothetical protein